MRRVLPCIPQGCLSVAKGLEHAKNLCLLFLTHSVALLTGWTQIEAVESLVRKAGYLGPITDALKSKLKVTRYQSSLFTLTYAAYVDYVKRTRTVAGVSTSRSSARVAARRYA